MLNVIQKKKQFKSVTPEKRNFAQLSQAVTGAKTTDSRTVVEASFSPRQRQNSFNSRQTRILPSKEFEHTFLPCRSTPSMQNKSRPCIMHSRFHGPRFDMPNDDFRNCQIDHPRQNKKAVGQISLQGFASDQKNRQHDK
jgi:hypothetical protein